MSMSNQPAAPLTSSFYSVFVHTRIPTHSNPLSQLFAFSNCNRNTQLWFYTQRAFQLSRCQSECNTRKKTYESQVNYTYETTTTTAMVAKHERLTNTRKVQKKKRSNKKKIHLGNTPLKTVKQPTTPTATNSSSRAVCCVVVGKKKKQSKQHFFT